MKILYKPFGMIAAVIAARVGRNLFRTIWSTLDDAEPPHATTAGVGLPKVVGAAALEAATMAAVAAAADRVSADTFHHLTGIWPGDKQQQPAQD